MVSVRSGVARGLLDPAVLVQQQQVPHGLRRLQDEVVADRRPRGHPATELEFEDPVVVDLAHGDDVPADRTALQCLGDGRAGRRALFQGRRLSAARQAAARSPRPPRQDEPQVPVGHLQGGPGLAPLHPGHAPGELLADGGPEAADELRSKCHWLQPPPVS